MRRSLLIRAWLATAASDFVFSSVLVSVFYHSTVTRLWQGVASVPFGQWALQSGLTGAVIGVGLHLCTAFTWTSVFVLGVMRMAWVRRTIVSGAGVLLLATVYGPLIWLCMSFVVIPSFTHRPPTVNFRWWVQTFGHIVFVALPMLIVTRRGLVSADRGA